MNLGSLFQNKKRSVLASVAVLVLVGIGVSTTIYTKRQADSGSATSDPSIILRSNLQPQDFMITAGTDVGSERNFSYSLLTGVESGLIEILFTIESTTCLDAKHKQPNPIPIGRTVVESKDESGSCRYTIQRKDTTSVSFLQEITISGANYSRNSAFKNALEQEAAQDTQLTETITRDANVIITRKGEGRIRSDGTFFTYGSSTYSVNGYVDVGDVQVINSKTDLTHKWSEVLSTFLKPDSTSTWTAVVDGKIDYKARINFEDYLVEDLNHENYLAGRAYVSSIELCKNLCNVSYTENRNLKARKLPGAGGYNLITEGDILSNIIHTEKYSGSINWNKEDDTLKWNPDLTVVVSDDSVENYQMTAKNVEGKIVSDWKWDKKSVATNNVYYPVRKIMSEEVVEEESIALTDYLTFGGPFTQNATIKTELTSSSDDYNDPAKLVQSSYTTGSFYEHQYPAGYGDSNDPYYLRLDCVDYTATGLDISPKVTGAKVLVAKDSDDSGKDYIGTPFEPFGRYIPDYTQTTYTDGLIMKQYHPFNQDDSVFTMASPMKYKVIPNTITVLVSNKNDVWTNEKRMATNVVLSQAKILNNALEVKFVNLKENEDPTDKLKDVPKGSLVINAAGKNGAAIASSAEIRNRNLGLIFKYDGDARLRALVGDKFISSSISTYGRSNLFSGSVYGICSSINVVIDLLNQPIIKKPVQSTRPPAGNDL